MSASVEGWTLALVSDARTMSEAAARIVAETVAAKPNAVISVPTGSTPLGLFDILVEQAACGTIDLSGIQLFCLDEYVGVSADSRNSLTGWLHRALVNRVGIPLSHVHPLPATAADIVAAASAYENDLASLGGLDLAILGLGPNGHIAYNEPGSPADSRTRVVALTPESIAQAADYWQGEVSIPATAVTIGVGTLLEAKRLVLLVSGAAKADILRRSSRNR
jgi:glucosamine-6-phosphate deaminase